MAKSELSTIDQDKGHTFYRVLVANARKRPMEDLVAVLMSLEKKGAYTVLAQEMVSKTKLLRQFDHLRLFFAAPNETLEIDPAILSALDSFAITDKSGIEMTASTFKELDVWLKWNIKEQTAQYQLRGGALEVREDKERQANGAVLRTCHYSLRGDMRLTMQYRDRMLEQRLADPKTIKYKFWDAPVNPPR